MSVVRVSQLRKTFQVVQTSSGFLPSVKSLFRREYKEVKAVDTISFELEEGELVGFIGPNGAGKTTTLKCLSGVLHPTSGVVTVLNNVPFERKQEFLKKIALVAGQKNQLLWDLPAKETFKLNKEIYEIPNKNYKETLNELVKLFEIEDILDTQVRKLSLGQRMKCELIASLLHSPQIIFLDEPTIGLDVVMQKNIRDFLKEYNHKYQATILLTSHYMEDVKELCRRVIIIDKGKILFDGELSEIVEKYAPFKIIEVVFGKNLPNPVLLLSANRVTPWQGPSEGRLPATADEAVSLLGSFSYSSSSKYSHRKK